MGHKPFWVLADYLARRGIATLRYDDRGVGRSTGDFANATTADFADDANAAINYLRSSVSIDASRIGLIGHSEGGLVVAGKVYPNSEIEIIANGKVIAKTMSDKTGEFVIVSKSNLKPGNHILSFKIITPEKKIKIADQAIAIKISDNKERIYINYNKLINNLNFANKYNLDKDNIYYEFKSKFLNA